MSEKSSNRRQKMEALGKMKTKAGTPNYVSPEVLAGSYKIDCDMWSVGCLLYILICGYPPFEGDDDYELCQNILKGRVEFDGEEWDNISKECKNLISSMICKPEKRLTAEEALQHKWFKKTLGKTDKSLCSHKIKCDNYKQFKNFGDNT
jgi:calcium-dependent protein kinase